jgi:heme-degrading monooxygenase HmoA
MHVTLSRYAGAAGRIGEAAPKVQQSFVPMLKAQKGFDGYAAFASEQGDIVAITIWENAEALTNSRDSIRAWVQNNLQGFDEPTERFHGEVGLHAIVAPQSGGPDQSLYCMVRKAENLPSNDINRPITEALLATIQKTPGFRGVYFVRSNDDPTRGASILFCDTRENATAAHEASLAIMRERRPETSVRVAASGKTAILAMA